MTKNYCQPELQELTCSRRGDIRDMLASFIDPRRKVDNHDYPDPSLEPF